MGFISRKIFPSCGSLCVCCPALRPSSRRPVKRYKKLLAEIFPKTLDGPSNDRKIMKLCEYAAKNPLRIPKIAKFLEQRSHKELRLEHVNFIKIITEAYGKLLYICKEQMAYFAISLVNVINELLESKHQDIRILGCQTLTKFIYSQGDSTYARSIESLVCKVCTLSHENGEEHILLRAASLQCLSAMIWFMTEYSYMFADFDEIINSILGNYRLDESINVEEERNEPQHNWVDEIVRCEGRAGATLSADVSPRNMNGRPRHNARDSSTLTREQRESPEVWSHICVQKLAELAKESTTMRRVLDPMLAYFDQKRQWAPRHGLALLVLSDMSYLEKSSGNEQMILSAVIRHLDHKNVANNSLMKTDIIQTATSLARQLRSRGAISEMGIISDLCRHLRKCLEATGQTNGLEESNLNESLQNSIEDCLLEIVKGINDVRPLFDMMAITLEKLPTFDSVARATIGSLLILSHIISLTLIYSPNMMVFPDPLLLQLLKSMMHPDAETRLGAHLLFSSILVRAPNHPRSESEYLYETKKWQSRTTSVFASATALLEKLRKEKESLNFNADKGGMNNNNNNNNAKERNVCEKECKSGVWAVKGSSFFTKLGFSLMDRISASISGPDLETNIVMLTEDQTAQLLSSLWVQANQTDNLPFNYEAIAYSFSLILLSSRVKNSNHGNTLRFFQLPLTLWNFVLMQNGTVPPSCQRSIFTMATSMIAFAGKMYQIFELTDTLMYLTSLNVDPYLRIGEDMQLYVKLQSDQSNYGSETDQQAAQSTLNDLRKDLATSVHQLLEIISCALSKTMDMEKDAIVEILNENFMPEDVPSFGPGPAFDWVNAHALSEESLSLDEECSRSSSVDGWIINESPAGNFPSFVPRMPAPPPSLPHVISVGQLLESALHVAGQVAGTSVSTSPLPYGTMASQCEALVMGSRKKLSSWLVNGHDDSADESTNAPDVPLAPGFPISKINCCSLEIDVPVHAEPWRALRLPPASPFDNFLKAAGC